MNHSLDAGINITVLYVLLTIKLIHSTCLENYTLKNTQFFSFKNLPWTQMQAVD